MQGAQDFFATTLSQEAATWVTRIVQFLGRSKSAKPVTQASVGGVILDKIQSTNIVEFGPELVALKAWEALGLTPMLEELGLNESIIATAQLVVANRVIHPLSEWALIGWSQRTALP